MTGGSGLGPKANAEVRVTLIAQSWRLDKAGNGFESSATVDVDLDPGDRTKQ